jgi:hypothetical protein
MNSMICLDHLGGYGSLGMWVGQIDKECIDT